LRRAQRFGWQYLAREEPFLCRLVKPVVKQMDSVFRESRLKEKQVQISKTIEDEEQGFLTTLGRGFRLFERAALDAIAADVGRRPRVTELAMTKTFGFPPSLTFLDSGNLVKFPFGREEQLAFIKKHCRKTPVISGKAAFDLHTEQGLFIDITEQMAGELGL